MTTNYDTIQELPPKTTLKFYRSIPPLPLHPQNSVDSLSHSFIAMRICNRARNSSLLCFMAIDKLPRKPLSRHHPSNPPSRRPATGDPLAAAVQRRAARGRVMPDYHQSGYPNDDINNEGEDTT